MEEIARSAGLSRATVYKHFSNKDALYRALLDRTTEDFVAEVKACIAERRGPRETLRRIVEIAHRVYSRSPVLLAAVAEDDEMRIEEIAAAAMRRQEARVISLLAEVLEAGVQTGAIRPIDPKAVAYLMYQLGNVLVVRELSGRREFPLKQILDAMDDLINLGLARSRARARTRTRTRTR
jgi:TetR/AcrR family transcriptional regulator